MCSQIGINDLLWQRPCITDCHGFCMADVTGVILIKRATCGVVRLVGFRRI